MDAYNRHKDALLAINDEVLRLITASRDIPQLAHDRGEQWEKTCRLLPQQMAEDLLRVAVVGTIKSGKSTLLNSLLGGDHLKRGAGVVTSIVTRVHNGSRLRATLFFKSWEEVNRDMEQALVLFPSLSWRSAKGGFDIRNPKEREELTAALRQLPAEQMVSQDARNLNTVLLTSYLNGYDQVRDVLGENGAVRHFEDADFGRHRAFVGSEDLAVYLRDVTLEIDTARLGDGIEVADCQGSDSPNPLHLAMIQDYLLMAHLLVYVVSSRTGLRRADIRFLNSIRRMGILENTIFVVNCDFSEHENLEDLQAVAGKVARELSLLHPGAKPYCVSALYNLFDRLRGQLSEKDRQRLSQWEKDAEMIEFAAGERRRFEADFRAALSRRRYRLMFRSHLERLGTVLAGLSDRIQLAREIMGRDAGGAQQVLDRIRRHQERLAQIDRTIADVIQGSVAQLKRELQAEVNRYLDAQAGPPARELQKYIRAYDAARDGDLPQAAEAGFAQALYQLFQRFRQDLDAYLTESVNPAIVEFLRAQERRVTEFMQSVTAPYEALVADALADYQRLLAELDIEVDLGNGSAGSLPDTDTLLRTSGLRRPSLTANMGLSARVRTGAAVHYNAQRLARSLRKLLKRPLTDEEADAGKALQGGLRRMKQEALAAVAFQLTDFRENLKFNYLWRLADAAAGAYTEVVRSRFEVRFADLNAIHAGLKQSRSQKASASERLSALLADARAASRRVAELQREISASG